MKKFKLIDKHRFYVNDNYNDETYFTTEFVLIGEADRLLDNMIEECEDEHDRDNYNKLDINDINDIDYILESANIYIYPYSNVVFKY